MYAPNVHEITQRERDIIREQSERVDFWHDEAVSKTCEAIESNTPLDPSLIPARNQ